MLTLFCSAEGVLVEFGLLMETDRGGLFIFMHLMISGKKEI
jgi:hypothetical protein